MKNTLVFLTRSKFGGQYYQSFLKLEIFRHNKRARECVLKRVPGSYDGKVWIYH